MSVRVIYHGHANVEIHVAHFRIQVDPFYTSNPLADVKAEGVNPTHIFLSHAHFDHTEDALALSKRTGAPIASNYEIASYFEGKGAATQPMNHGGGFNFPFGRALYTVAFHTSSFPDGSYGGQPGGWIFEFPPEVTGDVAGKSTVVYFAGDTGLFSDMKLYGELYNIDLACLPIGDNFTMGPAHAIKAAQFLKTKRVLPLHYNTWPVIAQDVGKFAVDLKAQTGIDCLPISAGESFEI